MPKIANSKTNTLKFTTQSSLDSYVWGICNILRRSNCAGALQYVPELTWILFLRILDDSETLEAERSEAVGAPFSPSLEAPYRWQDWAAPDGAKRIALQNGALGAFFGFVNGELLPYLKGLRERPNANSRQKVISEILSGVERVRVDTEKNFLDVLDKVHEIRHENIDTTHIFALSQVYEGLLLKMGEKGNDGGQFFTPREVIRTMVRAVDPRPGQTVYDPACGTGGFLAQTYEYIREVGYLSAGRRASEIEAGWIISPSSATDATPTDRRSKRAPFSGVKKKTSSIRLRWQTWCCMASTSRTCGTATPSPGRKPLAGCSRRAGAVRCGADQSTLRRQGRQGSPDPLRL